MKFLVFILLALLESSISVPVKEDISQINEEKQLMKKTLAVSTPISTASTQIAALGRVADLGDLYDARRDNFVEISLYTTDLSGDAVHSTDNAYSAIDYVRTESLSEKMEKLGVSASLSVSFLGGLVSATGSGKYLNEDKKSAKSAKTSLVYSVRTVRDDLKIFSKNSRELIDKFLLENIDATHVVVGVEWGADVVLSLEETNTDSSNAQEIQGKLEAALNLAVLSVSGSAEVDFGSSDVEKSSTFSLHLNGDIIPNTVPQTINESIAFIRNIPQLIEKENGGKGKIMNYILMPLSTVQKVFDSENNKSGVVKEIEQELIDQFMMIFQEMKDSGLQINDVYNDMSKWTLMIPENEFSDVSNMKSQFDTFANDLRVKFADLVVQFRNDELDETALKDLISSYLNSNWTFQSVSQKLDAYTPTMHKIRLMNLFEGFNAVFIDRRMDKYKILASNYEEEVKILSVDLSIDISSPYVHEIVRLLKAETENESGSRNYYIEDEANLDSPVVKVYLGGNVINSFPVDKKQYVVLISEDATVTIIDANSYEEIGSNVIPELAGCGIAIVNNTFYKIDARQGRISCTSIENIMKPPENGTDWNIVGSFPPVNSVMQSNAAVNGTDFYFLAPSSFFYKYDTALKTLTACGNGDGHAYFSSVVVNNILYLTSHAGFYYYDGTEVFTMAVPETRNYPGLFEFKGNICLVGGEYRDVTPYSVYCYDPKNETWTVIGYINKSRWYPAVTKTQSGTLIFGGESTHSNSSYSPISLDSVEIFNHNTKIWSYVPSPPSMVAGNYIAATFYY